ncbi:hypothetical protein [Lacimonas salitolerans]|uniref:Uncharacterized protein n=1 Tax=Lacimonas salitolerans TaxID=1323750 RepID=A0ABW4EEF1_9RHOB
MMQTLKTRLGLDLAKDVSAEPVPPKVTRTEIATLFRYELGYAARGFNGL